MAQPTAYNRLYDLTSYAAAHTSATYNAAYLDAELDAIEQTLSGTLANLALIQRDDGLLKNESVHVDTFTTAALALMSSANWTPLGAWVTATAYVVGDIVEDSSTSYVCTTAHTSGTFATDHTAGKWIVLGRTASATIAIEDASFTVIGSGDNTKVARFEVDGITAGATRVMTIPDYNGTLATLAGIETLTNKTLTGAALNGTLGATTPSSVAATTISATGTITATGTLLQATPGGTNDWTIQVDRGGTAARSGFAYDYSADKLVLWSGGSSAASPDLTLGGGAAVFGGTITAAAQPAFSVKPAATIQNETGDGTAYTVVFDTEIFDQGGDFSSTTFTAPIAGRYQFNVKLHIGSLSIDHATHTISLVTSNRTYTKQNVFAAGANPLVTEAPFMLSQLADMDAGDTAYVTVTIAGGLKVCDIDHSMSYFSGFLAC